MRGRHRPHGRQPWHGRRRLGTRSGDPRCGLTPCRSTGSSKSSQTRIAHLPGPPGSAIAHSVPALFARPGGSACVSIPSRVVAAAEGRNLFASISGSIERSHEPPGARDRRLAALSGGAIQRKPGAAAQRRALADAASLGAPTAHAATPAATAMVRDLAWSFSTTSRPCSTAVELALQAARRPDAHPEPVTAWWTASLVVQPRR